MKKSLFGALASAAASLMLALTASPTGASAAWKQTDIIGDLNGDSAINVADLVVLSKHLHGSEKLNDKCVYTLSEGRNYTVMLDGNREVKPAPGARSIQKADIDQNGAVEVFDLVALRKIIIAESTCGQILQWEEEPPVTTVTTTTAPVTTTTTTTAPPAPKREFIKPPVANMYGSMPSQGKVKMLIFYVDFPDCKFSYEPTTEEIERIAFGPADPNATAYPFESMSAFYSRASKGCLELSGKAYKYTCKKNIAAYQGDVYKSDFATEVIKNMDPLINYKDYDSDGNKQVDAILFCVPGKANKEEWWSCSGEYYGEENLRVDGMEIGHIITGNDDITAFNSYENFVVTYLHEMGHCMGLPDYYLYDVKDFEGMHGSAGYELMDEMYSDFSAVSKLMLGWLREDQIQVFDPSKGEQTFTLINGQTDGGNCLVIPRGDLKGYKSEFFIVEYLTLDANNSRVKSQFYWRPTGSGISVKHIEATQYNDGWRNLFKYKSGNHDYTNHDKARRFIRLVDDGNKDNFFRTGSVISGSTKGFAWYDESGRETIDPNIVITVGEKTENAYTVTVSVK